MAVDNYFAKRDIKRGYEYILSGLKELGYDIKDGNFKGTADRCTKAFLEDFVWPKDDIINEAVKLLGVTFPGQDCDEMIVQADIPVVSLCPHHLLPVDMKVTLGYIPKDKVLGLSKLARLAILIGKQPILQESYAVELAKMIQETLQPKGVGVYVSGLHGCMRFRGVKLPEVATITTKLLGNFKEIQATREEFLSSCRGH